MGTQKLLRGHDASASLRHPQMVPGCATQFSNKSHAVLVKNSQDRMNCSQCAVYKNVALNAFPVTVLCPAQPGIVMCGGPCYCKCSFLQGFQHIRLASC